MDEKLDFLTVPEKVAVQIMREEGLVQGENGFEVYVKGNGRSFVKFVAPPRNLGRSLLALAAAFLSHLVMCGLLLAFGFLCRFRLAYLAGWFLIVICLVIEHWIARRRSLNWINIAFFRLNALEASLKERSTLIFDQRTPPFDLFGGVSTNLFRK